MENPSIAGIAGRNLNNGSQPNRNDDRLSQMAEMRLPNGGGSSLGNKPITMRNGLQSQTLD
jgi:hypothetical protein